MTVGTAGELTGRGALLTGGSPEIRAAIARELAAAGAALAAVGPGPADVAAAFTVAAPQIGETGIGDAIASAVARLGRLDILVHVLAQPAERIGDAAGWRHGIAETLDAAFLWSKLALPHLRRSDGAVIIHVAGLAPARDALLLEAAQAGLAGLTRALAHELGESGITVNCLAPLPHGGDPALRRGELAALVRHLCGPGGRYVTGQVLHLGGIGT